MSTNIAFIYISDLQGRSTVVTAALDLGLTPLSNDAVTKESEDGRCGLRMFWVGTKEGRDREDREQGRGSH